MIHRKHIRSIIFDIPNPFHRPMRMAPATAGSRRHRGEREPRSPEPVQDGGRQVKALVRAQAHRQAERAPVHSRTMAASRKATGRTASALRAA